MAESPTTPLPHVNDADAARWTTALHEAGHLAAYGAYLGHPATARIMANGGGLASLAEGYVTWASSAQAQWYTTAMIAAAGPAAESLAKDHAPPPRPAPNSAARAAAPVAAVESENSDRDRLADVMRYTASDARVVALFAIGGQETAPEKWAASVRRIEREAAAFVVNHDGAIVELAKILYVEGCVTSTVARTVITKHGELAMGSAKTVADVAVRRKAEAQGVYREALASQAEPEKLVALGEAAGLSVAQIEADERLVREARELSTQVAGAAETVRRAAAAETKLREAREALEAETRRLQAEIAAAEEAADEPRAARLALQNAEARLVELHQARPDIVLAVDLPKPCAVHLEKDRLEGIATEAHREMAAASTAEDDARKHLADLIGRANAEGTTTLGGKSTGVTQEQLDDAKEWIGKCVAGRKKARTVWEKADAARQAGQKIYNAAIGVAEAL